MVETITLKMEKGIL